jgi:Amt family ammonium transporter
MLLSRVQLLRLAMGAFLLAVTLGSSVMAQEGTTPAETPVVAAESGTAVEAPAEATPAQEQVEFNTGDVAWMMVSCAFVLMMTAPGLSLFYSGLVRKRNVLSVIMQCMFLMGMMSVVWFVYGYSLAFAPSIPGSMGFVGGFDHVLWKGVIPEITAAKTVFTPATGTIPTVLWAVFQMMFFIITPGLICGAYAERMKFSSMVVFSLLWGTFVYCPIAHWVWSSDGWLSEFNTTTAGPMFKALDFAGGTVVHISSGVSALVCAIIIGKRLGHGHEPMPPHNLTYTSIGTALLWVGWFGFNAGSAGAASTSAVNAFASTHMAAATGLMTWAIIEWVTRGHASILGACTGAVAGLVAITPASGSVTVLGGIMIGLIGTLVSYFACTTLKGIFKYDDALDVFGVHGMAGISGALLTGIFASESIKPEFPGLLEGNANQMIAQAVSVGAAAGLAVVGSVIILGLINATIGLRVSKDTELQGLDLNEHGEEGYIFV